LKEKLQHSYGVILENLADKNTPYKDKRKITVELVFTQNEARDDVTCEVKSFEKPAKQTPTVTHIATGRDLTTGEIYAEEYGGGIRGQISMDDASENNVVDFREVK